jgi:predicted porin
MKKTLIALAAVAATGAAFAQSSVTLYGVADVAVGDDNSVSAAGVATKFGASANGFKNNGSSRFGLRGSEDLGGGLKANFNIEAGVNLASGATAVEVFDRAAFMSVSGGFGEVAAGRRLTPAFFAKAAYELTGTANYSAIAKQFNYSSAGTQALPANNASGARKDALVTYTTPNMGGLTATIGTVLSGNDAEKPMELNVIYRSGPMVVAAQLDSATMAGVASKNKRGASIGGSYDLGVAKVAASYQDPAGNNKGFTIGASMPMGAVTLTADIARRTDAGNKNTDFLFEAKYALSKRTFAYGVYYKDGGITGVKSVNHYAVGVRHNF